MTAVSESTVVPNAVQRCPVGIRVIPPDVDFVYVMRRDAGYVADQFAARLDLREDLERVRGAYDRAVEALAEAVLDALGAAHAAPAVDLIDADDVDRRRRELIATLDGFVVSMDPLMEEGALPLAFSRCYRPGGEEFMEMIPRPGYPDLDEQVAEIAKAAGGKPLVVVEDDFFTGDTLLTTLGQHLGELGRNVAGVVAGTKVGPREPAFPVLPAVRYVRRDGGDTLQKVDLGDPRDFVVGASGLVCRLASGSVGRLPYVLPFVSPHARATIPVEAEDEFSAAARELSRTFYDELSAAAGRAVRLDATDPAFATASEELFGVSGSTPMDELLDLLDRRPRVVSAA
jgi:hypothetical protein